MSIPHESRSAQAGRPGFSAYFRRVPGFSPWLLVGLSTVLALVIMALAWRSTERVREHITQNFLDRADALIWALEAATRTGMGFGRAMEILQPFVVESARQRGILYIAVVDEDGRILAHSRPEEAGTMLPEDRLPAVEPSGEVVWRTMRSADTNAFEVYREFSPPPGYHRRPMGHGHGGRMRAGARMHWRFPRSFALIAFDNKPYEALIAREAFTSRMTALVAAALALGSVVSLFWADGYRRSRRLLKDSRALASEVVSSLPVGLVTCKPDGTVGMVNETALTMLRMDRHTAAGASLSAVPGLDWQTLIDELARNAKLIEREMRLCVNGNSLPVMVSASQIRDEDGLFLGQLFILRDISEMKRLQAEARRNEKFATLGSLAAGVAHEIRNPLSSIKGAATLLLAKMRSSATEAETEAAHIVIAEADRLNRVVSQLLDFAKPNAVKLAHANINEVITRALRLADADIRTKHIRLDFAEDAALPPVPMHAERFTQALLNLFLNAVQAMEPGGRLEVSVGMRDDGTICAVRVQDDGRGMTQEMQAAIFTPYFTTKASGAGLGLAIVHQIMEGHGGSISVNSAPGAGSAFTLLLPMRAAHENAGTDA